MGHNSDSSSAVFERRDLLYPLEVEIKVKPYRFYVKTALFWSAITFKGGDPHHF